jgi:hypothetical protein
VIEAVVKRKLGSGESRACERSENLLTSTAFGLLRYLPHDRGVIALLQRTRRASLLEGGQLAVEADDARNEHWLGLNNAVRCEFQFWPSLGKYGQPDLVLSLFDEHDICVCLAAVEVKFDSIKGSSGKKHGREIVADGPDDDQLAKYWQGIASSRPEVAWDRKAVIYLTSQVVPPTDELAGTLGRNSEMRLGWLSWREVSRIAESLCKSCPGLLPAADLARLLEYHGFQDFKGFHGEPFARPRPGRFWRVHGWFVDRPAPDAYPQTRFWRA